MESVASGNEKRDFLHCLLVNLKSDKAYVIFRVVRTFYFFDACPYMVVVNLKFDQTLDPAIHFFSPVDQTD